MHMRRLLRVSGSESRPSYMHQPPKFGARAHGSNNVIQAHHHVATSLAASYRALGRPHGSSRLPQNSTRASVGRCDLPNAHPPLRANLLVASSHMAVRGA